MPYCGSCGKEVAPGKKFCKNCGRALSGDEPAPQEPAAAPASAGPRLSPALRKWLIPAIALCIIVLLPTAIFFAQPLVRGTQSAGAATPTKVPTTIPATIPAANETTTPAIPQTTVTTVVTTITPVPVPAGHVITDLRDGKQYNQADLLRQREFSGGEMENFSLSLQAAPLVIRAEVEPTRLSRGKVVGVGTTHERVEYYTYPDPDAWFRIRVLDAATAKVMGETYFGKSEVAGKEIISGDRELELTVRDTGSYVITLSGYHVNVSADVLTAVG